TNSFDSIEKLLFEACSQRNPSNQVTSVARMSLLQIALQGTFLAVLGLQTATAKFRVTCETFASGAFMDPLEYPGKRSSHRHDIGGSLGFNANRVNAKAMQLNVSTCDILGDFSNYWAPTFYFHEGQKKIPLVAHFQAYYEAEPTDVSKADAAVLAQPLSMIIG
ncbi:unnamed protein product, partial [Phaeothamnion confervicola]